MLHLSSRSRVLVGVSALLLMGSFFAPLWKIELHAPQYPEGIGMLIRIDTLTGIKPADIDNLNGLNHYIGMKTITPDVFPALRIMPWVAGGLIGMAILVALTGLRVALLAWLVAMASAGAAGFAEFYRWTYDYGHDLAPDAIIKVPGMSYQPPILGSKQLLNFTATSWPDIGGWLAFAAFMVGVFALLPLVRRMQPPQRVTRAMNAVVAPITMLLLALVGCNAAAKPAVDYGRADCDVCEMRIVDQRFGGAAVTSKGKTKQFDSVRCLAGYVAGVTGLQSIWVSDFDHPGTLIDAVTAKFVRRSGQSSEMGSDIVAFDHSADDANIRGRFGATVISWQDVQTLVAQSEAHADESQPRTPGI